jgi:hypothetical protein
MAMTSQCSEKSVPSRFTVAVSAAVAVAVVLAMTACGSTQDSTGTTVGADEADPAASAVSGGDAEQDTPETTAQPAASTTTTTTTTAARETIPQVAFAELVAGADRVLEPTDLPDGQRFAILGYEDEAGSGGQGSLELIVETPDGGWETRHTVSMSGFPTSIETTADLDGDGAAEIQTNWFFGANTDFGVLYRVDAERMVLSQIEFATEGLHEPMGDYEIISVEPGFVTTSVESCDPSCADGGNYTVTWQYDAAADRLVVASQPDPAPDVPVVPAGPGQIAPGVIEDGVHHGYVVSVAGDTFSFDRAEHQPEASDLAALRCVPAGQRYAGRDRRPESACGVGRAGQHAVAGRPAAHPTGCDRGRRALRVSGMERRCFLLVRPGRRPAEWVLEEHQPEDEDAAVLAVQVIVDFQRVTWVTAL